MKVVVSISVVDATDELATIKAIRAVTKASLVSIRAAIEDKTPVYEAELFLNDFADVADKMRALVRSLGRLGAKVLIAENGDTISRGVLWNMLEDSGEFRG